MLSLEKSPMRPKRSFPPTFLHPPPNPSRQPLRPPQPSPSTSGKSATYLNNRGRRTSNPLPLFPKGSFSSSISIPNHRRRLEGYRHQIGQPFPSSSFLPAAPQKPSYRRISSLSPLSSKSETYSSRPTLRPHQTSPSSSRFLARFPNPRDRSISSVFPPSPIFDPNRPQWRRRCHRRLSPLPSNKTGLLPTPPPRFLLPHNRPKSICLKQKRRRRRRSPLPHTGPGYSPPLPF